MKLKRKVEKAYCPVLSSINLTPEGYKARMPSILVGFSPERFGYKRKNKNTIINKFIYLCQLPVSGNMPLNTKIYITIWTESIPRGRFRLNGTAKRFDRIAF